MSKKKLIAIITIIVLLFTAGISVGVFLYTRGTTQAADINQTDNQDQLNDKNQDANENKFADNTSKDDVPNIIDDNFENNETVENDVINVENNIVNDNGNVENNQITTSTNISNVDETTISRVEEQERLTAEQYFDWWKPMRVAVKPTEFGMHLPKITVEKIATVNGTTNDFVYAGQEITYVIAIINNGENLIEDIEISDKIPEKTTYVEESMKDVYTNQKLNVENARSVIVKSNDVVTGIKWTATINPKETVYVSFTVKVNEGTTGTILNMAVANGEKSNETITTIVEPEKYNVELNVPGKSEIEKHDEIILMVDGSYSGDDEWDDMKNAIIEIGKTVLNGNGNTQLTLMAFGMGDNEVLTHVKTVENLENALGNLPGTLLYGRSSTNCEAGFTGVSEYIDKHDESLNNAYVIYISDGEINTDETEYNFYNWTSNTWLKRTPEVLARWSILEGLEYYQNGITNLSNAYKAIFGEEVYTSVEDLSDERVMEWATNVWRDVYEYSNMNPEYSYTVSDAERAFVKYDKEHNTHIQEIFYYALWGRKYQYSTLEKRTIEAGNNLAAKEEVKTLYIVDSNSNTAWMKKIEKSNFIESTSISKLIDALKYVLTDLSKTPYNDVVLTTYTTKWFNLDKDSISIIDNSTGEVIYTSKEGWKIEESKRPTNQENPVKIETVDSEENTSGDMYKITWYVKDGALLRSNSYRLVYDLIDDYLEEQFEYGNEYPLSSNTIINYIDENGKNQTEELM